MNKVIDNIERRIRRNIDFRKEDLKEYVLLCVAYFIAYISIIRADYNYADDIGRKFSGYHGWNDWSRWSTMILSNFIHADWVSVRIFRRFRSCYPVSLWPQFLLC